MKVNYSTLVDTTLLAKGHRFTEEEMAIIAKIPNETKVRNHLLRYGNISDHEARDYYGISRLAAVIYRLRHQYEPLMNIVTIKPFDKNRFGQTVQYARYFLVEDEKE